MPAFAAYLLSGTFCLGLGVLTCQLAKLVAGAVRGRGE